MKLITSKENRLYKLCSRLAVRKYREKYGQYVIEGEKLIYEAIKTNQRITAVIAEEGWQQDFEELPCGIVYAEKKLFASIAQTEHSQGVLAIVEKQEIKESIFQKKIGEKYGNVILLDRLQDPGNIGTIIRTADAAGYRGIIVMKGTADLFSPKVVRAAAGSLFRIPVLYAESPQQAAAILKKAGKTVVATGFDTDLYYYDTELKENIALIIGNEGNGVSTELLNMAQKIIKIPMNGEIDSLNAAVAAGILMYESVRN